MYKFSTIANSTALEPRRLDLNFQQHAVNIVWFHRPVLDFFHRRKWCFSFHPPVYRKTAVCTWFWSHPE